MGGTEGEHEDPAATDPLRALEQRLERASLAAERLLSEAAWSAAERLASAAVERTRDPDGAGETDSRRAGAGQMPKPPPPAGWEMPPQSPEHDGGPADLLLRTVNRIAELVPADLRRRLAEALRELLLALRALIDWWVERLEHRRTTVSDLEDIPIL